MMKKTLVLLSLFSLIFSSTLFAEDLMKVIGENNEIFSVDRPRFITNDIAPYFRWTSAVKDSARYPAYKDKMLELFGIPLKEVIVKFRENSVSSLYISLYNRGDSGEISYQDYNELLKKADAGVLKLTNVKDAFSKKEKLTGNMYVYVRIRKTDKYAYILKYSFGGTKKNFSPEYIQIEIEPYNAADDPCKRSYTRTDRSGMTTAENLLRNVQREAGGNVWIQNIPMVDQGEKGYCAAAVCERVLRYYGSPVTQHTIAQIAGTSKDGGTDLKQLLEMLEKLDVKFGIKVKELYSLLNDKNPLDSLDKLINAYNKLAKKQKKEKVERVQRGNMVYPDETMANMDPELFLQVRSQDSEMKDFLKNVHDNINAGIPLMWGVTLGLYPEDKVSPQTKGGHLRLIIGYNDRNREILYTDTWGIGHELKSMPQENAWAMTKYLMKMELRPKR